MAHFALRSLTGHARADSLVGRRSGALPHAALLALLGCAWTPAAWADDAGAPSAPAAEAAPASETASEAPAASEATAPAAEAETKTKPPAEAPEPKREQERAARAAEREEEAKRSGNVALARRLSALASRWQAVVTALRTAADVEAKATALEQQRLDVREQTERLITLLEQTEARRARALARLQELGIEPSGLPLRVEGAQKSGAAQ